MAATAGTLQFNSVNSYTLSGTATITLDTTNVDAALSVLNGSHTIAAPLVLYSSTDVTASNPGNTLTISGVVSGGGALKKFGAGTLLLTANETYSGGTIVSAGTLVLGNGGTTGMVPGSVTNNGTLVFNLAGNQLFTGGISGAGSVMTSGPAALSVQGPLAAGQVTVNQGQFTAAAGTNIAGMLTIAPSAEFFNSVGTAYLGSLANSGVFSSACAGQRRLLECVHRRRTHSGRTDAIPGRRRAAEQCGTNRGPRHADGPGAVRVGRAVYQSIGGRQRPDCRRDRDFPF